MRSDGVTLSRALAEYATTTALEAIPGDVLATTKRFIVDTVGVAFGGSTAPGTREVAELVLEEAGGTECTVWPTGSRTSASAAAFLNSMYASALDFDSVYEPGSIHADTVVLPVAWAVAERRRVRGRDFLAAVALGNDVACRLGRAAKKNPGWFATSIHGVFGAAAAAGRLLGLDARAVQNAFGIALSQAGGTQQAILEKSLTKRLQPAFAARAGLFSALLAGRGITAPSEAFEGKFGFAKLYVELDRDTVLDGLGARYDSLNTTATKYPSCPPHQPLVD